MSHEKRTSVLLLVVAWLAATAAEAPKKRTIVSTPSGYQSAASSFPQAAFSPAASGFYQQALPYQAFPYAQAASGYSPAAAGFSHGLLAGYDPYSALAAYQPFGAELAAYLAPKAFRPSAAAYPRPVAAAQQSLPGYAFPGAHFSAGLNAPTTYSALQPQFQQQFQPQFQTQLQQATRVGPATFGAHGGGQQATAATNQVNNGGYGFVRPN